PASRAFRPTIGGEKVDLGELSDVEPRLIERACAGAKIAKLLDDEAKADGPKGREPIRKQIVEASVRSRVSSPYTAFLVLETANDYARFGIDRSSLADLLTVGDKGMVALHRGPES